MSGLVSVVMPFHDMEQFIAASVDSVIAQTSDDWELLLVDDGSTDSSLQIARAYEASDPKRIRLLSHGDGRRRGASAARNLAIAHARGSVIALLDSDDLWRPEAVATGLGLLAAHPDIDVVYGRTYWWYSWRDGEAGSAELPADFLERHGVRSGRPMDGIDLFERCLRNAAAVPSTISLFARSDAVERSGGFEETFTRVYTDQVFYAKLFLRSRILAHDGCWAWYRRRGDSSSAVTPAQEREYRRTFLHWLREYLVAQGHGQGKLARTVTQELTWLDRPEGLRRIRRFAQRLPGRLDDLLKAASSATGRT